MGNTAIGTLRLPGQFGCVNIIDGQHRLYSYARLDEALKQSVESDIEIFNFKFDVEARRLQEQWLEFNLF